MVPDTQRYALAYPHIFRRQFQWIRDSVGPLHVKYVMHVGDIVDEDTEAEWRVADEAFSLIDGVVPFIAVPGNHDLDAGTGLKGFRSSTRYNALFSPKRFENRPWYGGHRGVTADNSFGYFTAGGQQFLVLGLEFGPSDETLEWAAMIAKKHQNTHRIILVTHCYLMGDDTRVGPGDDFNPHTKFGPAWNDGEDIWEKFVRKAKSVGLVLSGHVCDDGAGCLVSTNDAGRPVVQMVANYQFLEHGGKGWLRILKFQPREKRLEVYTYSPWLNAFREDRDHRFSVDVAHLFP
ncbi:MAG: metallophosphoesterase [Opitutaceae bacterium]|nr:metallophosphoesterase [Opitutaceae bacterium]